MKKRSFYLPSGFISKHGDIVGSDAFHISNVLRMKPGDRIEVFDGVGSRYLARIACASRKVVKVILIDELTCEKESSVSITLAQAMLKDKKMDVLVRQLTEIGFSKWVPFTSSRSGRIFSKKILDLKMKRWHKISVEAVKQCQRSIVPQISCLKQFGDILRMSRVHDISFIFWEDDFGGIDFIKYSRDFFKKILIVIGPEGGFEEKEIEEARRNGFIVASLGRRILRAETASVVACGIVQYFFGNVSKKA